jgi:hypothetical protein
MVLSPDLCTGPPILEQVCESECRKRWKTRVFNHPAQNSLQSRQDLPSFHRSATNLSEEALRREVTLSFSGSMFFVNQALAL